MKTIKEFENLSLNLKSNLSFQGGNTSCCETEFNSTHYFNSPQDAGDDHTVTFFDDSNNQTGWQFVNDNNLSSICPLF